MLDIKITGGLLYDGTGKPPQPLDIGIVGDKIAALEPLATTPAHRVINAAGKCVCPGFIDVHSHSDIALLANSRAESQIRQGITTEVIANCGLSPAPLHGECRPHQRDLWKSYGVDLDWTNLDEYRARLQSARPAVNVATLVGHNTLRACVLGYTDRQPNASELEQMKSLLAESLDAGAVGMSTGLIYTPGVFSQIDELIALAKVCAERGALYTTHMRSESDRLEEAVEETLRIGRESGASIQISHLKTSGRKNWHKIDRVLAQIEQARERGLNVNADRYPYTASATELDVLLPKWAYDGGAEAELARLRDPATRARLREELFRTRLEGDWDLVRIAQVSTDQNKIYEGKPLREVASMRHQEPPDAVLDMLIEESLQVGAIFEGMSEANLERFLSQPWLMIGSDSAGRADYGVLRMGHPHPRTFGTFPRFLSFYAPRLRMPVEEAIRKMTSLPATKFSLRGRGVIRPDAFADIVIFDPATLKDTSSYEQPWQYPTGIDSVLVNGRVTVINNRHADDGNGRVL